MSCCCHDFVEGSYEVFPRAAIGHLPSGYFVVHLFPPALLVPASMTHPLIVVAVPTGSGTSGLAIDLALGFSGEVVNCDSVQVYRHLNIGTAKLTENQRQGIPHHLIDIVDPNELFTAGEYLRIGRSALREIRDRQRTPIVAGGTGFYLKALIEGLFQGPQRSELLRARLASRGEQRGAEYLHRLLSRVDPQSAKTISARDKPKMIRALEVYFLT